MASWLPASALRAADLLELSDNESVMYTCELSSVSSENENLAATQSAVCEYGAVN